MLFNVGKWIEGAAITTSELTLKCPALLRASAICRIDATVPLLFQLPPMSALIFVAICLAGYDRKVQECRMAMNWSSSPTISGRSRR